MNTRLLAGILVVLVVASGSVLVAAVAPGVNIDNPFGPSRPTFDNPGDATPSNFTQDTLVVKNPDGDMPDGYVRTYFTIDCQAQWCQTSGNESLTLRVQSENQSSFDWEGLYSTGVQDGDTVTVGLRAYESYNLLLQEPDGRIHNLRTYTPTSRNATVVLTVTE